MCVEFNLGIDHSQMFFMLIQLILHVWWHETTPHATVLVLHCVDGAHPTAQAAPEEANLSDLPI